MVIFEVGRYRCHMPTVWTNISTLKYIVPRDDINHRNLVFLWDVNAGIGMRASMHEQRYNEYKNNNE
jgi:hypothetical protein